MTLEKLQELVAQVDPGLPGARFIAGRCAACAAADSKDAPCFLFLRLEFVALDVDTGREETQAGRRWIIEHDATHGQIVQTCLKAVLTAVEHEARERFTFRGRRVFGPHMDVDQLASLA